jgi:hypothetical protein
MLEYVWVTVTQVLVCVGVVHIIRKQPCKIVSRPRNKIFFVGKAHSSVYCRECRCVVILTISIVFYNV